MIDKLAIFAALVSCLTLTSGCLSKTELPPPRYFSPVMSLAPAVHQVRAVERSPLRLREVTAAEHLADRMVWTTSYEYGFYEEALWTEKPAAYVEAALARTLFEQGPFRRATGAKAPILDVRVVGFEEFIGKDQHQTRVALHLVLLDAEGQAVLERTVVGTSAVGSNEPDEVAQAIGAALDQAIAMTLEAISAAR